MATTLSTSSSGPAPLATLNQPPFLSKNLDQTRVSCSTGIRSTTVPLPGASSASSAAVVNPELYVSPEWLAALLKRSSGSSSNNSLNSSSVCSDKTSSIPFKVFDIRPSQFFSASRIKGAIHLQLPNLILRRLRRGPVRLSSLMSDSDSRQELERHSECNTITIVLYEESPMVQLLVKNFSELGFHTKVLKGNFANFENLYPELCERTLPNDPSLFHPSQQGVANGVGGGLSLSQGQEEMMKAGGNSGGFSQSANAGDIRIPLCNLRISCSQPVTPANLRDFRAFNLAPDLAQLESPKGAEVSAGCNAPDLSTGQNPSLSYLNGQTDYNQTQCTDSLPRTGFLRPHIKNGTPISSTDLPSLSSGILTSKSKSVDLFRDSNLLSVQSRETGHKKHITSSSLNSSSTCLRHSSCNSSGSSSRNPLYLTSKRAGSLTQILPNLYLGDQVDSRDALALKKHGIRAILNVTPDLPNHFEKKSVNLSDTDAYEMTASCPKCDLNATNFTSKSEDQTPTRESLNENSDECQSTTERGKGGGGSTTSNSEDSEAFEDLVGEIKYLKVPIDDQFSSDIMLHFPGAIAFIDDAISSGVSVLVHCLAGVSRSVTIMIAYLICSKRMQLAEAIEHVRRRRPNISPNFNFMGQLLEFEKQQHHLSSNSSSPVSTSKTTSLSSHSSPLALSPISVNNPHSHDQFDTLKANRLSPTPSHLPAEHLTTRSSDQELQADVSVQNRDSKPLQGTTLSLSSSVFVTTPGGNRSKLDSTGLTPRDFYTGPNQLTSLDTNCNFTYLASTSEDIPVDHKSTHLPGQLEMMRGSINAKNAEDSLGCENDDDEEEEDVFMADEKAAIYRSFSDARFTATNTKRSNQSGTPKNSFAFKNQRQMSEAASLFLESETNQQALSSWDDATDLVHISLETTSVDKAQRTFTVADTPRETISSECDLEHT
ncbi:uncharacterized protein LOC134845450 isoform X2 [Symsagittifera roscoffensis]|uniref:uncharacterized protein LOC134845450 isoform X2 n=1 Tax=Symsagittifera roscoffensis TaxID=84072 RepID=UPI00307BF928